ncbi:hypothetical protein UCRPA7_2671 [Phaeoacremonium minimum UCRPA7]|uniref:Uncharacterized protein n=1 Tax=Phaeoacremonium minimum (strain UCR-PA7) TaxID=1286976 RepID=R8BR61_PHAM7|nr:hypothetical protein UCRPA7_2671 [Phaeoacremonium minimum UCRPA7]EOO01841.1 hypothetical protein UCRPA7_2671 [Phaeoacremonium minimum UCRPA7]
MELTGRDNLKAWVSGPLPPGLPTCLEPFLHCQVTDECIRLLVPPAVFGSDEEEEESEKEDKEKTKEEVAVVEHGHGGRRDVLHGGDDSLQWQLKLQHLRYEYDRTNHVLSVLTLLDRADGVTQATVSLKAQLAASQNDDEDDDRNQRNGPTDNYDNNELSSSSPPPHQQRHASLLSDLDKTHFLLDTLSSIERLGNHPISVCAGGYTSKSPDESFGTPHDPSVVILISMCRSFNNAVQEAAKDYLYASAGAVARVIVLDFQYKGRDTVCSDHPARLAGVALRKANGRAQPYLEFDALLDHEVSPDASPQMAIPLDAFVSKAHRPAVATLGESIAIPRPALAAIAGKVKAYYSEPRRGGDACRKQLRREYASQPPLTDFTWEREKEEVEVHKHKHKRRLD